MSSAQVTKYDLTADELDFLRELTRQGTKFLMVGMMAAIFQGADGLTRDIDLWFQSTADLGLDKAVRKLDGLFVWRGNPPYLEGRRLARVDVVNMCHGLGSFEREYARAHDLDLGDFSVKVLDGMFSYNLRTPPSREITPSGKRIYTMSFMDPQPDPLVQFLVARRDAILGKGERLL